MIRISARTYFVVTATLILVIYLTVNILYTGSLRTSQDFSCHYTDSDFNYLKDTDVEGGGNIFFHETSCTHLDGQLQLTTRQACSVESAARANPNTDVYLLVSSSVYTFNNNLVKELLTYKNVKIRRINIARYLSNTPLENILHSGSLNRSYWPLSHTSDVLRYATLFKHSGTYLDLDVIVTKSFEGMKNFVGAESLDYLNSAVLNFGADNVGRDMAVKCVLELARSFRGDDWGYNGPGVITRVLRDRCHTLLLRKMTNSQCDGFTIYPPAMFYPVTFRHWKDFFDSKTADEVMELVNNEAHSVHVWNKITSEEKVNKNTDTAFVRMVRTYCPRIYRASDAL